MSDLPVSRWFGAVCVLLALTACSTASTFADMDNTIGIPAGSSFSVALPVAEQQSSLADPLVNNAIVYRRLQQALERALFDRGLHRAEDPALAEFAVSFSLSVRPVVEVYDEPYFGPCRFGPCWRGGFASGWGPAGHAYQYDQAQLVVDITQRNTGLLAWRGVYRDSQGADAFSEKNADRTAAEALKKLTLK